MKRLKQIITIISILSLVVGCIMSVSLFSSAKLVETVLYTSTSKGTKTASAAKVGSWFKQVREIRKDIMAHGPIDPTKGEYYKVVVTGSVDNGTSELYMGENVSWEEYHGTSDTLTTEESTATLVVNVPIYAVEGDIYVCDTGELGHTISWSSLTVSVYRDESSLYNTELTMYGDAAKDDTVDMKDILAIRRYIANINPGDNFNITNADANADTTVDMKDVLLVRKHIANIVTLPTVATTASTSSTTNNIAQYDGFPDQITLSYLDQDAKDVGITWHTYLEGGHHVIQYVKNNGETPNFAEATTIEAVTTPYQTHTMPYDYNTNLFVYGFDISEVTDYSHKASLTNLEYDTTYSYRVGDTETGVWSNVGSFTTRKENVSSFSFIEFSDTQDGSSTDPFPGSYMNNAIKGGLTVDPAAAFMFNGGDFVQCSKYLHLWRSTLNASKNYLQSNILMPVTGNHDSIYDTAGEYEIFKHFNINYPEENNVLQYGVFYSYDYGNAHFIVLNSDCFKSSAGALDETQLAWLEADLAANTQEWTIVLTHRPMFAIRQADACANKDQLLKLFNDNGVDLVIQSHEHTYMRSYPIDGNDTILKEAPTTTIDNVEYYVNPQGVCFITCATGGSDGKYPLDNINTDFCHTFGRGYASSWGNFSIDGNKLTVSVHYDQNGVKDYENGTWGIIHQN